jgi:hypothetical protein
VRAAAKALGDSTNREVKRIKKRVLFAAGRTKIARAAKRRWAKARALGKLSLEAATSHRFGGPTYSKLKPDYSDAFDDFEIDIEEIEDATDDELEDLFVRLQLGTPLTTAEKLNALAGKPATSPIGSPINSFFGRESVFVTRDTLHFDIATKWLFIEARGIQPQMRFSQLDSFLRDNRSLVVG